MPPPLLGPEGLLRRTFLPATPDPYYNQITMNSVPLCGPDDTRLQRLILGSTPAGTFVDFPEARHLNPLFRPLSIDDPALRRILSATGGFVYDRGMTSDGRPLGNGVLHLCRDEPPASGGPNGVFISNNAILNNQPGHPTALRLLSFQFRPEEIMAIVHGLRRLDGTPFRLPSNHYMVDPADHTQLSLYPDRTELQMIIEGIQSAHSPIPPTRRAPMVAALRRFIETEANQADALADQRRFPPWMLTLFGVLGGAVASAFVTVPLMIWMQRRNERVMRELQGGLSKVDPKGFTTDVTEAARAENYSTLVGQERVLDTMRRYTLQPDMPHVILTGPAGSGKSATMLELFHQIATGRMPHLRGRRLLVLEAGKLSAAGAVYAGLSDKALQAFIDEARRQPSVVWVREAHQLVSVGLHSGNKTSGALDRLKAVMEDPHSGITFVLDSDRSLELMSDEAIARRTQVVVNEPPRYSDVTRVVEGYAERYGREYSLRFERDSIRAITLLADYKAGAAPSSHKLLMGNLVADARMRNADIITSDDVVRVVAYEARRSEGAVRRLLEERTRNPQLAEAAWAEPYIRHARENGIQSSVLSDGDQGATRAPDAPRFVSSSVDSAPVDTSGPRVVADTSGGGTHGTSSGPRVVDAPGVTPVVAAADSAILPAEATPEIILDRATVRAQVILTYSRYFMSQAAREALLDFRPLPEGDAAINSAVLPRIESITDAIMDRYDYLRVNNSTELARLWDAQRERGFLTRHGVPEGLVTSEGGRLITDWSRDARVAEFGADAPLAYEREARNRLGNTESFRRGMIELLRRGGR